LRIFKNSLVDFLGITAETKPQEYQVGKIYTHCTSLNHKINNEINIENNSSIEKNLTNIKQI